MWITMEGEESVASLPNTSFADRGNWGQCTETMGQHIHQGDV